MYVFLTKFKIVFKKFTKKNIKRKQYKINDNKKYYKKLKKLFY